MGHYNAPNTQFAKDNVKPAPALQLPAGVKCRLLEEIPPADLQRILAQATRRRLTARQVLIHAGDPAESFFILLAGRGRSYTFTEEGQRIIVINWEPGAPVGGASLLPRESRYLLSTEVVEDGYALEWTRTAIRNLFHQVPSFADNTLLYAAELVQESIARRLELLSQSAEQRLAKILLETAQASGRRSVRGVEILITNEQLAEMAGMSPFTVARTLSAWSRSGGIRRSRGKIEIRSLRTLIPDQASAL